MGLHQISIIKTSGETLFQRTYSELPETMEKTQTNSESLVNAFLSALLQFAEVGMGLELHEVRVGDNIIAFKKFDGFFVVLMIDLADNIEDYKVIQDRLGSSFSTFWNSFKEEKGKWDGKINPFDEFKSIADGIVFGLSDKDIKYELSDELYDIAQEVAKGSLKSTNGGELSEKK